MARAARELHHISLSDDPFERAAPRYSFEMTCREEEGLVLETRAHWITWNLKAERGYKRLQVPLGFEACRGLATL